MIILGIDPGYEKLGAAILEKNNNKEELLFSSCIKTDKKLAYEKRLLFLGQEVEKIIKKYKPNILAIEKLDRKSTRLNSSHIPLSRMPSSA